MTPDWGEIPHLAIQNCITSISDDNGAAELFHPAPQVLFCRCTGHLSERHTIAMLEATNEALQGVSILHYFGDWETMKTYDSASRTRMMDWGRQERSRLKSGTFVCGTRIVEMGVNVAGMAMALIGIQIRATTRQGLHDALLKSLPPRA